MALPATGSAGVDSDGRTIPVPVNVSPPLTPAERVAIVSYLSSKLSLSQASVLHTIATQINYFGLALGANGSYNALPILAGISTGSPNGDPTSADQTLISEYDAVVNGQQELTPGASPGLETVNKGTLGDISVPSFLADLSNPTLWTRVAEGVIGGILLIVGINVILKSSSPGYNKATGYAKSTAKTGAFL